jgi:hypothetical protein
MQVDLQSHHLMSLEMTLPLRRSRPNAAHQDTPATGLFPLIVDRSFFQSVVSSFQSVVTLPSKYLKLNRDLDLKYIESLFPALWAPSQKWAGPAVGIKRGRSELEAWLRAQLNRLTADIV